ncbi:FAD-dependent oxidoreductase [Methylibium sp.]|uniref:FAD-dependent oxidoreductase n=1 Tax=Methylibium sp. TaxID=2067992 RepID=UPI003D129F84
MKRLLLIGAGHAHAQVLLDWIAAPLPGVELVLVSPSAQAPYSGMVPGWLAGVYDYDDICIDFKALARAAGAHLVIDTLASLDPNRPSARLTSGTQLGYDLLSLNVGSTLNPPTPCCHTQVLALRPLASLRTAWETLLGKLASDPADSALTVTAVGGGAAGVEALLAVLARLRSMQPLRSVHGTLVSRNTVLLADLAPRAAVAARAALASASVVVQLGAAYADAATPVSDLLLWAAGAEAHAWQPYCGLAVNAQGFIRIDGRLRSISHPNVYAVGDCADSPAPLPKAGVHAVRMGSVLSRNLRAALGIGTAAEHRPQRRTLALLSTADGRAIASWGGWSTNGRWAQRWKNHLDRGFLGKFSDAADHSFRTSPVRSNSVPRA